jgi:hypothetical protein
VPADIKCYASFCMLVGICNLMRKKNHIRIFIIATIVWFLFFILGLPDYYLQYPTKYMIWFEVLLLIPFSIILWIVLKPIKASRRIRISLWYSFYFTIPLALYDYIYCGIYLKYGFRFMCVFWFLSVYYLVPWFLFPAVAVVLNKRYGTKLTEG